MMRSCRLLLLLYCYFTGTLLLLYCYFTRGYEVQNVTFRLALEHKESTVFPFHHLIASVHTLCKI